MSSSPEPGSDEAISVAAALPTPVVVVPTPSAPITAEARTAGSHLAASRLSGSDARPTTEIQPQAPYGLGTASDPADELGDFVPEPREAERPTAITFPAPVEEPGRRVRYDLLGGVGLLLALLALIPLLFLNNEPEELPVSPRVPEAGAPAGDVQIHLAEPVDLTNQVQLTWTATEPELNFGVVIATEGEETRVVMAERNLTMKVDVQPGLQYCFLIQGTDSTEVYESNTRPLRGATCTRR